MKWRCGHPTSSTSKLVMRVCSFMHLNSIAMTTALWAGRAMAKEVWELQDQLYHWALGSSDSIFIAQNVVNYLQEDYLLSLLPPEENHHWPSCLSTRNWRYLCRRHITRLLGWKTVYLEGHPWGIPTFLNEFFQTKHWPTFLDEELDQTSSGRVPTSPVNSTATSATPC